MLAIVTTDGQIAQMPQADWDRVQSRIAELEAALAFYSDPASYCKIYGFKSDDPRGFAPVLTDDGQRARAALAKT